jgi:hypothetical protein
LNGQILVTNGVLLIKEGVGITATDLELTTNGSITLNSISNSYSSLIVDNITNNGTIQYNRYVNSNTNGNDLIAPPLDGQLWSDFLITGTNAADLLDNGASDPDPKLYAFGPFEKSSGTYLTWADNEDPDPILTSGTGYRAATDVGTTLTFTGDVLLEPTTTINLQFGTAGLNFADWNLIGNPYPSYLDIKQYLEYVVFEGDGDPNTTGSDVDVRNIDLFSTGAGIYGYKGSVTDIWDVITLGNVGTRLMAPGQGFLVPRKETLPGGGGGTLLDGTVFTLDMRVPGSSDDFIGGRDAEVLTYFKLHASSTTKSFTTQFYFNENSSLGLDHGYDGKLLGTAPSFSLYSHLVQDNTGMQMALQCMHPSDLVETTVIPLGVRANAGEQLTFTISESTLPEAIEVYLEDTVTNTFTLLNNEDYTLTPNAALNGTGRFYLRFGEGTLSTTETTLADLNIYTNQNDKTIVIAGQLLEPTTASVYDIQGRLVNTASLVATSRSQTIDVNHLSSGVYVVQLSNSQQRTTKKVILR